MRKQIEFVEAVMDRVAERESPAESEAKRRLREADAILGLSDAQILAMAAGRKS